MKTSKEIMRGVLEKRRLPVVEETERSIVIRYQLNYIQITFPVDDVQCAAIVLGQVFSADDEREMRLGLRTCNELNGSMMLTKFYIDSDNDLAITAEFFFDENSAGELLSVALAAVIAGKKRFVDLYESVDADDRIISEINESPAT